MKAGFWDYLKAAFNARPLGMFIPPNWVGLAGFGLAGFINPGFWLLGAGLELGYLYTLINSKRFRRVVDGRFASVKEQTGKVHLGELLSRLGPEERDAYGAMVKRCHGILGQQSPPGSGSTFACC